MSTVNRRSFLALGTASLALGTVPSAFAAPAVLGQARPFKGVQINGAAFTHTHMTLLKPLIPAFEEATGMKVNFETQAFPIFNQRADLELSTGSGAYDFLNITYIYASRWIGAGWFTPLDDFVRDPNRTPPDWAAADFDPAVMEFLQDSRGRLYGFPWQAGAMITCAARGDLLDRAGVSFPKTFAEMGEAVRKVHGIEGCAGYVSHNTHHFVWPPYLMGFGGKAFRDPPTDLTPTLDTPAAAESMQFYGDLLRQYSPPGVISFDDAQAKQAQLNGRANFRISSVDGFTSLAADPNSRVKKSLRFGLVPSGPAGQFPGVNGHGWGIPSGARNKEAAWEFIKWATSKETFLQLVRRGYSSVPRLSVLNLDEYRTANTINGQDIGQLVVETLRLGRSGYMKYRTVAVWPQIGDAINRAVERVATSQQDGRAAMAQCQREVIDELRRAGIRVNL
jgi:multiple sugar transport system substrate-binding protein